jgi:hypothetical protein
MNWFPRFACKFSLCRYDEGWFRANNDAALCDRVNDRVNRMLAGVKRDLDAADTAIGEKLRVLDTDNDGRISLSELTSVGGEVRINRSTCQAKPFYPSSGTLSTCQVKPFYLSSETVLPIKPLYLSNATCTATSRGHPRRPAGRRGPGGDPGDHQGGEVLINRSTYQAKPFYL